MRSTLKHSLTPLLLLVLGSVSILFGALQITLLSQGEVGAQHEMASPTYFVMPVPILLHIIFGTLFNLLAPLQFFAPLRQKHPKVHRTMGRLLVSFALIFGLSALWMNHVFPQYGGIAKYLGIVGHCTVLIGSFSVGIWAIRRRDVNLHRLWMMRLMAAALSPATQRLMFFPVYIVFGEEVFTEATVAGIIWAGLIINLLFVEWIYRRKASTTAVPSAA